MKRKVIIISIIISIIIVLIIRSTFLLEIRLIKEEFLIKWNYRIHSEQFDNLKSFFIQLPDVELNFLNKEDLEINYHCHKEDKVLNTYGQNSYDNTFFLFLTDTLAYGTKRNFGFIVLDIYKENGKIIVNTADSTFTIKTPCTIQYTGNLKSNMADRILEIVGTDVNMIDEIRQNLKTLNCFGYSKDSKGNVLINYRTTGIMFDTFSYLLLLPNNAFLDISYKGLVSGKLDNNFYWIHHEGIQVSYFSYMKLKNRKI